MPVRLDPFQNIVGVNWGGKLAALCQLGMIIENLNQNRWMMALDMVSPDVSGPIGGIDETESISGFGSIFNGASYQIQTTLFQEGSGILKPDGRENNFRGGFVIPNAIDGGLPEVVNLRVYGRSADAGLPTVAAIIVDFAFGPDLVVPNAYWFGQPEGLLWSYTDLVDPLPENLNLQFVRAQRERRFAFWGQRAFIRTVPILGPVADFGTLRLNFRRGSAEMLPPSTEPEET